MAYLDPAAGKARQSTQAAAVPNAPAMTSVVAAGATPTKAEYDALRVDVTNLHNKINALLNALRQAGTIA